MESRFRSLPTRWRLPLTLGEEEISRAFSSIDVEAKGFSRRVQRQSAIGSFATLGSRSIIGKLEAGNGSSLSWI